MTTVGQWPLMRCSVVNIEPVRFCSKRYIRTGASRPGYRLIAEVMLKSTVAGGVRRSHGQRTGELPAAVEGRIAEICRDLAVQVKRMRQLQEQADELRALIRQALGQSEQEFERDALSRAGRH